MPTVRRLAPYQRLAGVNCVGVQVRLRHPVLGVLAQFDGQSVTAVVRGAVLLAGNGGVDELELADALMAVTCAITAMVVTVVIVMLTAALLTGR